MIQSDPFFDSPKLEDLPTSNTSSVNLKTEKALYQFPFVKDFVAQGLMIRGSLSSIKSSEAYSVSDSDSASHNNETALSIQSGILSSWEAAALKHALFAQLANHQLKPLIYQEDDAVSILEFNKHKSHFVCVVDEEGVQFLWTDNKKPHSKFIPNKDISIKEIFHNVSYMLPTFEK